MTNTDLFFSQPLHPQQVKRLVQTLQIHFRSEEHGLHRQYKSGDGLDFYGTRPFEQGDDVRLIHWALSARTGDWVSKQMHQDRSLTTDIFVDANPSMHFAFSDQLSSFQIALRILHAWILLTDYSKDPLGLSLFLNSLDTKDHVLKIPIFSASRLTQMQYAELKKLYAIAHEQSMLLEENYLFSKLKDRVQDIANMQIPSHQRRTSLIVFSDFLTMDYFTLKEISKIKSPSRTLFVQIFPYAWESHLENAAKGLSIHGDFTSEGQGFELSRFRSTKVFSTIRKKAHHFSADLQKYITGDLNSHYLAMPWQGESAMMQMMYGLLNKQKLVMRGAK